MKKFLWISVIVLAFFSCREKNQVDVVNPTITSVTVDSEDSTVIVLSAGENITIQISAQDNMGLNQLQYNIHPADNEHVHTGSGHAGGENRLNSGEWFSEAIVNLSGTTATESFNLSVPDSIAGNWHLSVNLLDEVGLLATEYTILLQVTNPNLPVITATTIPAADEDGNIFIAEGGILGVSGEASDTDKLARLFVRIANWQGVSTDTTEIPITGFGETMGFNNLSYDGFGSGDYRLIIEAIDSLGYHRIWDASLIVTD